MSIWLMILMIEFWPTKAINMDLNSSLKCYQRVYNHTVVNKDPFGRLCWDTIPILACWGRCDSHEVPDWKFPFKISHHPVCIHDEKDRIKVLLDNCEENVQAGTEIYEIVQALSCKCLICDSSIASCEWSHHYEDKFFPIDSKK